jgi:hypothetical protein
MSEVSLATLGELVPRFEYAFDLLPIFAVDRSAGNFAKGERRFAKVAGGRVTGPLLAGELVGGADFPLVLHGEGGFTESDLRALIRTADGATIFMVSRGAAGPGYDRGTPLFDAPVDGPHAWLNRHMFVSSSAHRPDGSLQIRVFVVR